MSDNKRPIPESEYRTIAEYVPIVSVDLLVFHSGGLLLLRRENEPAKGEWFVPGGTVLKRETLRQAVHRVANEELGVDVLIDDELGVYEHFYDATETAGVSTKQYLATAFLVTPVSDQFTTDDQHSEITVMSKPFPDLHNYVERYIRDLRSCGYQF